MKIPVPFPAAFVELFGIGLLGLGFLSSSVTMGLFALEPSERFNLVEGTLWVLIAVIFANRARRKTEFRNLQIAASVAFLAFGISDFIEMRTGAWFRPWPLLVLKAFCLAAFVVLLRLYVVRKRKASGAEEGGKPR